MEKLLYAAFLGTMLVTKVDTTRLFNHKIVSYLEDHIFCISLCSYHVLNFESGKSFSNFKSEYTDYRFIIS